MKKGRGAIVSDYCREEPRLFRPMFLHKSNSSDMNIAVDKYMFSWLAQHPSYYKEIIENTKAERSDSPDVDVDIFVSAYRKLCEKFVVDDGCRGNECSSILENAVKESINYLDALLAVSKTADDRLERLRYQGEKSKHLFDRALEALKEEKNGLF